MAGYWAYSWLVTSIYFVNLSNLYRFLNQEHFLFLFTNQISPSQFLHNLLKIALISLYYLTNLISQNFTVITINSLECVQQAGIVQAGVLENACKGREIGGDLQDAANLIGSP